MTLWRSVLSASFALGAVFAAAVSSSAQCPEAAKLLAPDALPGDLFGYAVDMSDDVAIVGAFGRNGYIGAAFIYRFDPGTSSWTNEAVIPGPADVCINFGRDVAISGDVAWVAAPLAGPDDAGCAYVYRYDHESLQWAAEATIEPSETTTGFLWSIAVDGNVAIISTHGPGPAYVYRYDPEISEWIREAELTASDGAVLGGAVAIEGDLAIATSPYTSTPAAYVFRCTPGASGGSSPAWMEEAKLTPSDEWDHRDFGTSVDLSGERFIVGTSGDSAYNSPHAAYVFRHEPVLPQWVEEVRLEPADGSWSSHYSRAVAIQGNIALVSELHDINDGAETGAVYVYRREPTGWLEQMKLVPTAGVSGEWFGKAVSLSGEAAIVGASKFWADATTGSAYVFDVSLTDCNNNGIADTCEILAGTAPDDDGNGRPDECDADPGQYIGPDGGNWFEPANWNSGTVPDETVDATIPADVVIDQPGAQAATVMLTTSGGLTFVSGTLGTGSLVVAPGGVLDGTGTVYGNAVNAGTIDPGTLSIEGSYEQTAEGILLIELDGSQAPRDHDRLEVEGTATLDGTLITKPTRPDDVSGGQVFEIMTHGSRTGWFTDMDQPVLPMPMGWSFEILPSAIRVNLGVAACEIQQVLAPDAVESNYFGGKVNLSGDVAVVGEGSGTELGVYGPVRVFRFDPATSQWLWEASLEASDVDPQDRFGLAVAISGETIIAGATGADGSSENTGAAYVYRLDPGTSAWIEQDKLFASDGAAWDRFGSTVAVDGDRALVGAQWDDDLGDGSGAVYVFERDPGSSHWIERHKLLPSDGAAVNLFGGRLALEGNVAVVASYRSNNNGPQSGSAYVFRHDPAQAQWVEEAKLLPSTGAAGDFFGAALSVSGETIVIGAWAADEAGEDSGAAFVFRYDPDEADWIEQTKLIAPDAAPGDAFGAAVAVDGPVLVISGPVNAAAEDVAGALYAYSFDSEAEAWIWQAKIMPTPADTWSYFVGIGLALEGTTVFAGAPQDAAAGDHAGAVYVFDLGGACVGDIDADGHVGMSDFEALLGAWGPCPRPPQPCPADLDGDGMVGVVDFLILLARWG